MIPLPIDARIEMRGIDQPDEPTFRRLMARNGR
jgi:hypothetical protein